MAERPKADLNRLIEAGNASQTAVWERLSPISINVASRPWGSRETIERVRTALPAPLEAEMYRRQVEAARLSGGYHNSTGVVTPTTQQMVDKIGPEAARWYGSGNATVGRVREGLQSGEFALTGDGRLIPNPNMVTDEEKEALANPNRELEQEAEALYPVPGLGAGEFGSQEADETDRKSAELARQDPFVSTSVVSAYQRARTEAAANAAARRIQYGFRPARSVFNGDWDDEDVRASWLFENYPALAIAADQAGLTPQQVAQTTNLAAARDTALELLATTSVERRRQVIQAMPAAQAALVQSIAADLYEKDAIERRIRETQGDNPGVMGALQSLAWGSMGPGTGVDEDTGEVTNRIFSPGWALEALGDLFEGGQQFLRSVANSYAMVGEAAGPLGIASMAVRDIGTFGAAQYVTAAQNWDAVAAGSWNLEGLEAIAADPRYEQADVDFMKAAVEAQAVGSTQAYWDLLELAENNPRYEQLLFVAMNGVNVDEDVNDLYNQVKAQNNSNLGQIVGRATGFEPGSAPFDITADAANVAGFFVGDPLIVASPVAKGIQGARYGLYALGKMDEAADVGNYMRASIMGSEKSGIAGKAENWWKGTKNVRRYLDWYGSELDKIRGLTGVERGRAMNTLRSQSKRYFDEEALEALLKADVRDADSFYDFIQGADDFISIMRGQGAKRTKDMMIPHMSSATLATKQVSYQVRGLDPTRWITARAEDEMRKVFGDDFAKMTADEQQAKLVEILEDEAKTKAVAEALSDLRGTRSKLGSLVAKRAKETSFKDTGRVAWTQKYGWQRKKAESVLDFLVRWTDRGSRTMARFPTKSTLRVDSAQDAHVVYEMMRGAGLPRYWAATMRQAWVEMAPGQRRIVAAGLTRTYGYASGLHLVDPEAMKYLDEMITGLKSGDSFGVPLSRELIAAGARDEAATVPRTALTTSDPSSVNGMSSAVWAGQTRNQVALPNFGAVDALRARSSWMGSLLMQNRVGTSLTDWWTLATLAGPRFAVRNGVEDVALYVLTGNSLKRWKNGRQLSTAMRESSERPTKTVMLKQEQVQVAEHRLAQARRSRNPDKIGDAKEALDKANDALAAAWLRDVEGQKLGFVKTLGRKVGSVLPEKLNFLEKLILPSLTKDEISSAARAAANGNREELNKLIAKAYLRQRVMFFKTDEGRRLTRALNENIDFKDLPKDLQVMLRDLDDFIATPYGMEALKEASEQARHIVDGTLGHYTAALGKDGGVDLGIKVIDGKVYMRKTNGLEYAGQEIVGEGTPEQIRGVLANLHFALHTDGPKGQRAMNLLPDYFEALALGRTAEQDRIIGVLAQFIDNNVDETFDYAKNFSLNATDDLAGRTPETLARQTMDTLTAMFTRQDGKFHSDLYDALKVPMKDGDGYQRFKLSYDGDTGQVVNVDMAKFAKAEADGGLAPPAFATVRSTEGLWIPEGNLMTIRDNVWEMMGRSLARMTREPIYMANYLEARNALRPLENRLLALADTEEAAVEARKKVTDLAVDRAFLQTMSYVDNPEIRSRLAWSLRNVARFYRAQEDFIRRMVRMGENYPMGFYKAAVAWEAAQEVGFVHEDTYGNQYFVYPGSGASMAAVNNIAQFLPGSPGASFSAPVALTGNLQWITPSADPDSWSPTFSGPWSGLFLKGFLRALPSFNEDLRALSRNMEKELFGEIGLNQGIWNGFVPPNVQKVFNTFVMLQAQDPNGAQVAADSIAGSAIRKTMLALAANGEFDLSTMTPDELRRFRQVVDTQARNALVVQLFAGTTLPASPQLVVDDVSEFAREIGLQGMRPAFIEMTRKYGWEGAYVRWVGAHPELSLWAESESAGGQIGFWETTTETVDFIESNKDLLQLSATGLSYFAPVQGEQTLAAYNYLQSMGLSSKADPKDYLSKLIDAQGDGQLAVLKQWRDGELEGATTKERVDAINDVYSKEKARLTDFYNLSSAGEDQFKTPGDYRNQWKAVMDVAPTLAERGNELAENALLINTNYNAALNDLREALALQSGDEDAIRGRAREAWKLWVEGALQYSTDEQFEYLVRIATGALFGSSGSWPWQPGYGVEPEEDQ